MAPKVTFAALFGLSCVALSYETLVSQRSRSTTVLILILLPLNVLVTGVVAVQGDNDTLVAAFVGFAVVARMRHHLILSGALLGAATLTKYYPIVLIVFFCLDRRRIEWRLLLGALLAIVPGILLALLVWGPDVLRALSFGGSRQSTYLSPLRALDVLTGEQPGSLADLLARVDVILVFVVLSAVLVLSYALRLTWLQGSVVGLWGTLVTYKVGHAQYYLSLVLLLVALLAAGEGRSRRIVISLLPFIGFLELFQAFFFLQSQESPAWNLPLADLSGIVTTAMVVLTLSSLTWALRAAPRKAV